MYVSVPEENTDSNGVWGVWRVWVGVIDVSISHISFER